MLSFTGATVTGEKQGKMVIPSKSFILNGDKHTWYSRNGRMRKVNPVAGVFILQGCFAGVLILVKFKFP